MICTTILVISTYVTNKPSVDNAYVVDVASNMQDCSINTARVLQESKFYWEASDAQFSKWLSSYGIDVDVSQIDDIGVVQQVK